MNNWCEHVKKFNEEAINKPEILGAFSMVDEKVCMQEQCMPKELVDHVKLNAKILGDVLKKVRF